MNDLILFSNAVYNGITCDFYRDKNGDIYMTGEQIGRCLEYADPVKQISKLYKRYENHLRKYSVVVNLTSTDGKKYQTRLFNENGIYLVIKCSSQPKAMAFYDEVAKVLVRLRKGQLQRALERGKTKYTRRELTDVLRDSLPDSPHKHFMYKHYTDLAYKVAIGCTAKQFKKLHGLSPSATIKDYLAVDELTRVQKAEELIKVLVNLGKDYEYIKDFVMENFQAQKSFSSKTTLTQANQQLSG